MCWKRMNISIFTLIKLINMSMCVLQLNNMSLSVFEKNLFHDANINNYILSYSAQNKPKILSSFHMHQFMLRYMLHQFHLIIEQIIIYQLIPFHNGCFACYYFNSHICHIYVKCQENVYPHCVLDVIDWEFPFRISKCLSE